MIFMRDNLLSKMTQSPALVHVTNASSSGLTFIFITACLAAEPALVRFLVGHAGLAAEQEVVVAAADLIFLS